MKSLTTKIVAGVVASQIAAILIAMVIFPLFAPFVSYRDIAEQTVRSLALQSLTVRKDGSVTLEPTSKMKAYFAKRPALALAVIDVASDKILYASNPNLADLSRIGPYYPDLDGNLKTRNLPVFGDYVTVSTEGTRHGVLTFVTTGNQFGFEDIGSFFVAFLPAMLPIYGPVILGAAIFLPMFITRALRPVTTISRYADQLDPSSLGTTLSIERAPREFLPLINSLNAALARIDAGMIKQKTYSANAAHELRTPVTILKARIDRLPAGRDVADLKADVQRISQIIEQLLTAARLNQHNGASDTPIDLVAVVRNAVATFAPLAIERGRSIAFTTDAGQLPMIANALSVGSAVSNLIDNALRVELLGGTVDVSVSASGLIEVCDNGPGFDLADADAMFEAFWQRDPSSQGAGLGLAIVKDVAQRYNGQVRASLRPGGGGCFSIQFPITQIADAGHAGTM